MAYDESFNCGSPYHQGMNFNNTTKVFLPKPIVGIGVGTCIIGIAVAGGWVGKRIGEEFFNFSCKKWNEFNNSQKWNQKIDTMKASKVGAVIGSITGAVSGLAVGFFAVVGYSLANQNFYRFLRAL
jgi:hypothetical protein